MWCDVARVSSRRQLFHRAMRLKFRKFRTRINLMRDCRNKFFLWSRFRLIWKYRDASQLFGAHAHCDGTISFGCVWCCVMEDVSCPHMHVMRNVTFSFSNSISCVKCAMCFAGLFVLRGDLFDVRFATVCNRAVFPGVSHQEIGNHVFR